MREHNRTIRYLIGDVRDLPRLSRAMEDIDYVFHLAAMKHVPSCEYNPFEAVQTNIVGTQNVIQAALQMGVSKVLCTSTDKAVSPTNTYGATKLTAEKLISAGDYQKGPKDTVFATVRFGNVMGSRGSVIPLFTEQILRHRSISLTHREMLRYMMTPSQAIDLLLKANERSRGGEVYILKMPVIRLIDLAEVIIEEVCGKYNIDPSAIRIDEIGLRAGEKMVEELMTDVEALEAEELPEMYILRSHYRKNDAGKDSEKGHPLQRKPVPLEEEAVDKETLRQWLLDEKLV